MLIQIEEFFKSPEFAVIGASNDRIKYGNKVLRCYMQHNMTVYPVHPYEQLIEDVPVFSSIMELPDEVKSISIITPPPITEKIVSQAIDKGIKNIWMQPGAESEKAIKECIEHQINVIARGPCILVLLGYHEDVSN
jgi:predicted CoA-binding protein